MLNLRSERMRVVVDEDQGAEVTAILTVDGRNALASYDWEAPTPAGRGLNYGDPEMDWTSAWRGGWQETVPNAGQSCVVRGVEMGFHGDASRTRWTVEGHGEDWCHVRCPTRLPLVVERWMRLAPDRASLLIEGRVTNTSPVPVEFVWGQHPSFPLTDHTRIDVPHGCIVTHDPGRPSDLVPRPAAWPDAQTREGGRVDLSIAPDVGTHRLLYLSGHDQGWAAVRQSPPDVGVALAWDISVHPYIWLWTMRETTEFPWYGRGSAVALEAQAAFPYDGLAAASARGQAISVGGGASVETWYTLTLLDDGTPEVIGVGRDGAVRTTDAA